MKSWITVAVFVVAATMQAQDAANPVVTSANEIFTPHAQWMIAAAEEMPAEKYSYKPTAEQWSYGKVVQHVVQANNLVCAMLADGKAPATTVTETSPKADLVVALKTSFEFCTARLDALTDAKLSNTITFFGGASKPRARALMELTGDLEDHYSQMASYLRMNGLVPPSVKPKK